MGNMHQRGPFELDLLGLALQLCGCAEHLIPMRRYEQPCRPIPTTHILRRWVYSLEHTGEDYPCQK